MMAGDVLCPCLTSACIVGELPCGASRDHRRYPDPSGGNDRSRLIRVLTGCCWNPAIELVSPLMVNSFTDEQLSEGPLDTVADSRCR